MSAANVGPVARTTSSATLQWGVSLINSFKQVHPWEGFKKWISSCSSFGKTDSISSEWGQKTSSHSNSRIIVRQSTLKKKLFCGLTSVELSWVWVLQRQQKIGSWQVVLKFTTMMQKSFSEEKQKKPKEMDWDAIQSDDGKPRHRKKLESMQTNFFLVSSILEMFFFSSEDELWIIWKINSPLVFLCLIVE